VGHLFFQKIRNSCWKEAINPSSAYAAPYKDLLLPLVEYRDSLLAEADKEVVPHKARINARLNREDLNQFAEFAARLEKEQTLEETDERLQVLHDRKDEIERVCQELEI